jgi:hypothetical protein
MLHRFFFGITCDLNRRLQNLPSEISQLSCRIHYETNLKHVQPCIQPVLNCSSRFSCFQRKCFTANYIHTTTPPGKTSPLPTLGPVLGPRDDERSHVSAGALYKKKKKHTHKQTNIHTHTQVDVLL